MSNIATRLHYESSTDDVCSTMSASNTDMVTSMEEQRKNQEGKTSDRGLKVPPSLIEQSLPSPLAMVKQPYHTLYLTLIYNQKKKITAGSYL